jgi:quercetin dioxygenase-like cupin family protein
MGSIYRVGEGKTVLNENGVKGLEITHNKETELVQLTIESKAVIASHSLDIPVTFYIIEGDGTAVVDGDELMVHPGDVVEVSAGEERGWINRGESILKILAIKHN